MIDFEHLPNHSIIIAPSYLHGSLYAQLLESQDGKTGIRLHSLSSLISSFQMEEMKKEHELLFQYKQVIETIYPSLSFYKKSAFSPYFLKECLHMIDDMKIWGISCDDLPYDNEAQKEMSLIIHSLYPITSQGDHKRKALANIKKEEDFSSYYIYDAFYSFDEQQIIDCLIQGGAHLLKEDTPIIEKRFFRATNKRQEIEACAQYIITHDISADAVHITLADSSYQPLLQQIFDRYQIPYTMFSQSFTSIITKRLIRLFQYYLQSDHEHVMAVLDTGIFPHAKLRALQEYLQIFDFSMEESFSHLQQVDEIGNVLNELQVSKLTTLEEQAEEARKDIAPHLYKIAHPEDYEALFISIVQCLEQSLGDDAMEKQSFHDIVSFLEEVYPYIHSDEDISFFLPFLEDKNYQKASHELGGVIVSHLTQSCLYRTYHFLLGCTQKHYPAFPAKTGIFDETFYEQLPYPSMEVRYQHHIRQLQKILHHASYVYASYASGTYEGKSQEASLEIEQFMEQKATPYPLLQTYDEVISDIAITPSISKALLVKNGKIKGSISAMERYIRCPFSYFLRYGLSLQEPMSYELSDSYMGTLSHYVFETLVAKLGKEYTSVMYDKIYDLLQKEILCMQKVFPSLTKQLDCTKQRIISSILTSLQQLDDFEKHSHLQPVAQEMPFVHQITLRDDVILEMRGIIDRIDANSQLICVLDYKSSDHALSEKEVFAALKLQLITYSIIASETFHKEVAGAYYISLKNTNINVTAGKMSRRGKNPSFVEMGTEECQEALRKEHQLAGWTMSYAIEQVDDDGNHIRGVRQYKDGRVKALKTYDLSSLTSYFQQMYQIIGNRILDGHMECMPYKDACLYCAYHEICRFKGTASTRDVLVETGDEIYRKEGIEDV